MPYVKVYIHFVWTTKDRIPFLKDYDVRNTVFQHIRDNAKEKNIFIDFINGHQEHVHCLISLGKDQTIQDIMKLIKGESSHWINKENILKQKFAWQDEYFAVSVSESKIDAVRNYIRNQDEHHKRKTFQVEYEEFMMKYGFVKFAD